MGPNNNCPRRTPLPLFISSLIIIAAFSLTSTWARTTEKTVPEEEIQQRISSLYKEALFHYHSSRLVPQSQQENLTRAKDIFKQILAIDPAQKKARIYIDKKIPARQKRLRREAEKEVRARAREDRLESIREGERLRREAARRVRVEVKEEEILRQEEVRLREGASDFITIIKGKSAQEHFKDARYLYSIGKYEEALSLYNYAYDIAKRDDLKEEIRAVKRNARRDLAIRERELKKKILEEERLRK